MTFTEQEINSMATCADAGSGRVWPHAFAEILETALTRKMGEIEPTAYRLTENIGGGQTGFTYVTEMKFAYLDNCLEVTPLYARTTSASRE